MHLTWRVFAAALLVVVTGATGFVGGMYAWRSLSTTTVVVGEPDATCDLQRAPCRARFPDGGELVVSVTPRPIPLLKPIALEVQLRALTADSVEVDVSSPDMYMGYNRRTLRALDGQRYAGQTVLPVCVLDRMRWRLRAEVRHNGTVRAATFEFETVADRSKVQG